MCFSKVTFVTKIKTVFRKRKLSNNSGENQLHKRQKMERMESFARISFDDTTDITPSTSISESGRPEILRVPSDPGCTMTTSPGHLHLAHPDKRRLFARSKTDNSCYSAAIDVSRGITRSENKYSLFIGAF